MAHTRKDYDCEVVFQNINLRNTWYIQYFNNSCTLPIQVNAIKAVVGSINDSFPSACSEVRLIQQCNENTHEGQQMC